MGALVAIAIIVLGGALVFIGIRGSQQKALTLILHPKLP